MSTPLEWSTAQRKVNDLLPLEINPRKITEAKRMKMIESLQRFNLVDIPVIDTDGTIISGHQRLRALQAIGRGDELIDCRVPNRKLTAKEVKEYNLLANSHFGEFDFELLETDFGDVDFDLVPIDLSKIEFEQSEDFTKYREKFDKQKELNPDELSDDFSLPEGDKAPFQQITFTLADAQAEQVKNAIADIKQTEEYKYAETFGNENSNGNALYLIVIQWAGQKI